jgi:hypothetical protein
MPKVGLTSTGGHGIGGVIEVAVKGVESGGGVVGVQVVQVAHVMRLVLLRV